MNLIAALKIKTLFEILRSGKTRVQKSDQINESPKQNENQPAYLMLKIKTDLERMMTRK